MGHGGARKGAGRKKGSATRRTRETANKLAAEAAEKAKPLPLEIMTEVAQQLWASAVDGEGRIVDMKTAVAAATLAKDAAPYIHPRLSNVEAKHTHDFSGLSDAELAAELLALRGRAFAALGAGSGETEDAPARTH